MQSPDRATEQHDVSRFVSRWLRTIAAGLVVLVLLLAAAIERQAARRERASYDQLCQQGAIGDDWVSWRELITASPPIVQLEIPATIPPETTFQLLPDLYNLEYLSLNYDALTDNQLKLIERLDLESLTFSGRFPSDNDIERLASLRSLRFLHVPATNLSPAAATRLQSLLPSCKVTVD